MDMRKGLHCITAHCLFELFASFCLIILEMWANAQRDGRPSEYMWCPLFNAAKFADAHYYTVSQKKGATLTMAITLSILDRFPKFFHYCKEQ